MLNNYTKITFCLVEILCSEFWVIVKQKIFFKLFGLSCVIRIYVNIMHVFLLISLHDVGINGKANICGLYINGLKKMVVSYPLAVFL